MPKKIMICLIFCCVINNQAVFADTLERYSLGTPAYAAEDTAPAIQEVKPKKEYKKFEFTNNKKQQPKTTVKQKTEIPKILEPPKNKEITNNKQQEKTDDKTTTLDEMRSFIQKRKTTIMQAKDNIIIDNQIDNSTYNASNAIKEQAKTVYAYYQGGIYQVWTKENTITDIWLQPGEELMGDILGGDTVRWIVQQSKSGSPEGVITHIAIRPMFPDLQTNIIINTDKHSYNLKVDSTKTTYNPIIKWTYPQEEKNTLLAIKQKEVESKKDIIVENILTPEKLNFEYDINTKSGLFGGDYAWTPTKVFDDGAKTYIQLPNKTKNNELPALFVIDNNGDVNLVNYRVNKDYFIVDRIFKKAELRNGIDEIVTIENNK